MPEFLSARIVYGAATPGRERRLLVIVSEKTLFFLK